MATAVHGAWPAQCRWSAAVLMRVCSHLLGARAGAAVVLPSVHPESTELSYDYTYIYHVSTCGMSTYEERCSRKWKTPPYFFLRSRGEERRRGRGEERPTRCLCEAARLHIYTVPCPFYYIIDPSHYIVGNGVFAPNNRRQQQQRCSVSCVLSHGGHGIITIASGHKT